MTARPVTEGRLSTWNEVVADAAELYTSSRGFMADIAAGRVPGAGLSFVFTDYFACLRRRWERVQWGAIGGASGVSAYVTTTFHTSHRDGNADT